MIYMIWGAINILALCFFVFYTLCIYLVALFDSSLTPNDDPAKTDAPSLKRSASKPRQRRASTK